MAPLGLAVAPSEADASCEGVLVGVGGSVTPALAADALALAAWRSA